MKIKIYFMTSKPWNCTTIVEGPTCAARPNSTHIYSDKLPTYGYISRIHFSAPKRTNVRSGSFLIRFLCPFVCQKTPHQKNCLCHKIHNPVFQVRTSVRPPSVAPISASTQRPEAGHGAEQIPNVPAVACQCVGGSPARLDQAVQRSGAPSGSSPGCVFGCCGSHIRGSIESAGMEQVRQQQQQQYWA